jgi:hypothetical protein
MERCILNGDVVTPTPSSGSWSANSGDNSIAYDEGEDCRADCDIIRQPDYFYTNQVGRGAS